MRPRLILGLALGILLLTGCGSAAAPSVSGPATATPASGAGPSDSAHYVITGADTLSGDVPLSGAGVTRPYGMTNVSQLLYQDQAGVTTVGITFPIAACSSGNSQACGAVTFSNGTLSVTGAGFQACTWDLAQVTSAGGTGTVECNNAMNTVSSKADKLTVSFSFHD